MCLSLPLAITWPSLERDFLFSVYKGNTKETVWISLWLSKIKPCSYKERFPVLSNLYVRTSNFSFGIIYIARTFFLLYHPFNNKCVCVCVCCYYLILVCAFSLVPGLWDKHRPLTLHLCILGPYINL